MSWIKRLIAAARLDLAIDSENRARRNLARRGFGDIAAVKRANSAEAYREECERQFKQLRRVK